MPSPRTDLAAFAASLADRLPGLWTSDYQRHAQHADQFPRTEQLWDSGHVEHITANQPESPHRPGPPQVEQVLTLTLYSDGALGAPYGSVAADARMTLYAHGFQYHPHQAAFLLPTAYGDSGRALRVHGVVQQLTARGIGVNLRHSAPTTRSALPPASPKTVSTASRTR
ncbi:hypothetical protein ACPCAJ_31995 [Streptomyces griseoincarnatus]